jgi:hypothetical protein
MATTVRNSVALQSSNAAAPALVGFNLPFPRPKDGFLKVSFAELRLALSLIDIPQAYVQQLQSNPLRTKMITSGTLQAFQEYLASYLTGMKNKHGGYFTDRVLKMSLYGIFLQAPLNHVLVTTIQKMFAGRTGISAKAQQLLFNNLTVSVCLLNVPSIC